MKAMVFPSPEAVAPMKVPGALMNTPKPLLSRSAALLALVPMASAPTIPTLVVLPEMVLPETLFSDTLPLVCTPSEELPDMRL